MIKKDFFKTKIDEVIDMPAHQITSYAVSWNINTNIGAVRLLSNGQVVGDREFNSAAEFIAIHSILSSAHKVYIVDDGRIVTGTESIDG